MNQLESGRLLWRGCPVAVEPSLSDPTCWRRVEALYSSTQRPDSLNVQHDKSHLHQTLTNVLEGSLGCTE